MKTFIKYSLAVAFISFAVLVSLYFYSPEKFSRTVIAHTRMVLEKTDIYKPYATQYGLHPFLDNKIRAVIKEAKSKGINLKIISGHRTLAKQQELYMSGRNGKGHIVTNAPPGFSYHNYGLAVDVCEFVNGKPKWNSKHWALIGEIGKKHGLVWGGDWKSLVDKPHFQLTIRDIVANVIL